MVVFPSPYIYLPSNHIPTQQIGAYNTASGISNEDVRYVDIRGNPDHFVGALPDSPTPTLGSTTPDEVPIGLPGYYDSPWCLMVSRTDHDREIVIYRGLRHSEANLTTIRGQPSMNRVISNDAADFYYTSG